ncbi:MAG: RNA polymerase sigma factor [Phycisphaerales bacterium]
MILPSHPNPAPQAVASDHPASSERSVARPSLVERAMSGDGDAVSTLWENHRRWVAAVLLAHKPASADLDDLLQEVAVTLLRKVRTLDDPANFQPWLRVVALNVARLAGRKFSAGPRLVRFDGEGEVEPSAGTQAGAAAGGASLIVSEEAKRLMALAMLLHPDYREPLLLRAVHDLPYAAIGAILGLPETTIETRIARGRRMLREAAEAAARTRQSAVGSGVRMAASPGSPH